MAATKILFCSQGWQSVVDRIFAHVKDAELIRCSHDAADVISHARDVDMLIPTMSQITAEVMDAAPNLKLIHQAGVGLEGVDIPAATTRGIMVANVPSVVNRSDASVGELAIIHMMVLARRYNEALADLKAGSWGTPMGTLLLGKTAGIVGLGGIGRAIARRLKGFEMRLLAVDLPQVAANEQYRIQTGVDWLGDLSQLDHLLSESDFVVLCASLNETSVRMIGREQIAKMKPTAFLVNVARGGMVDYEALEEALREKRLAGAGMDVFPEEPVNPNHSIFLQNVSATPHVGATTDIAFDGIGKAVAENVRRLRAGEPILNCANAEALAKAGNSRR